jgi:hypothetical protein
MAKGKKTGGRKAGTPNKGFRAELDEVKACLPAVIPPKPLVDGDERDAAAQADDIMQHAGQMARAFRALIGKEDAPQQATVDAYLQWANVVLRTAALLLPYQRPTYRSIEVRTDKGIEERASRFGRFVGDPAERLAQIVVGAIIAQPDAVVPTTRPQDAPADAGVATTKPQAPAEPVDNGDGVIS